MDLTQTTELLRRVKEKLGRVIASLEGLRETMSVPEKGRRGRRSMSLEERQEVSARMTRYWRSRRKQRRDWS